MNKLIFFIIILFSASYSMGITVAQAPIGNPQPYQGVSPANQVPNAPNGLQNYPVGQPQGVANPLYNTYPPNSGVPNRNASPIPSSSPAGSFP